MSKAPKTVFVCQDCGSQSPKWLGRCADCPSTYDEHVYEALRAWRRERAADEKLPAYCVFTDATMTALAEIKPSDAAALVRVPGIGAAKIDKYGEEILRLCGGESLVDEAREDGSQTFFEISR